MSDTDLIFDNIRTAKYTREVKLWLGSHKTFAALVSTILIFLLVKSIIFSFILALFVDFNRTIGATNSSIQTGDTLIDLLGTRWDSWFYLVVADNGEYIDHLRPTETRVWNFAPLYPFFIRLFMDIGRSLDVEIPVTVAGVLVANIFSITSLVAFFSLARLYFDNFKSALTSLLFAFFPTTFLFSSVAYAESVFLTFAILSWYFFEKKNYPLSGLMLGLGSLARFPGALIFFLYIPIYLARRIKDRGVRTSIGSLLAIPLFPILVLINTVIKLIESLKVHKYTKEYITQLNQRIPRIQRQSQNIKDIMDFLDTGLSWILIFGVLPLFWMILVHDITHMTLSQIAITNWNAKFLYPFAGYFDLLHRGNMKWTLELYSYVFFNIGLGILALANKKRFSLLIFGQTALYTGYEGITSWGVGRYMGVIFHGPLVLAGEIKNTRLFFILYIIFLTYAFISLWEFVNWSYWII